MTSGSDPADRAAVLTAIGDWAGVTDPRDEDAQPYPDLLPQVRVALDWLTWDQPVGAAWPKDGIVFTAPAGPDVTIRVMVGDGPADDPAYRGSVIFERRGGSNQVPRITRAVADRLCATVAAHVPVLDDRGAIYMPGATFTWWAFLPAVAPSAGLEAAHRLNQTGIYHSPHDPAWRDRVARLPLPAGWMPDHGREYR